MWTGPKIPNFVGMAGNHRTTTMTIPQAGNCRGLSGVTVINVAVSPLNVCSN
jgi:hypothetical protein